MVSSPTKNRGRSDVGGLTCMSTPAGGGYAPAMIYPSIRSGNGRGSIIRAGITATRTLVSPPPPSDPTRRRSGTSSGTASDPVARLRVRAQALGGPKADVNVDVDVDVGEKQRPDKENDAWGSDVEEGLVEELWTADASRTMKREDDDM